MAWGTGELVGGGEGAAAAVVVVGFDKGVSFHAGERAEPAPPPPPSRPAGWTYRGACVTEPRNAVLPASTTPAPPASSTASLAFSSPPLHERRYSNECDPIPAIVRRVELIPADVFVDDVVVVSPLQPLAELSYACGGNEGLTGVLEKGTTTTLSTSLGFGSITDTPSRFFFSTPFSIIRRMVMGEVARGAAMEKGGTAAFTGIFIAVVAVAAGVEIGEDLLVLCFPRPLP